MKDTNKEYESAKELLESLGMRIDERTSMDARTEDRFTQKPTTNAPDMIQKKATTAVYAVNNGDPEERIKIVQKALEGYSYDDIVESDGAGGKRVVVKNLSYTEVAEDGFINDLAIIGRFKTALSNKIGAVNDKLHQKDYYINTYFDKSPKLDREYGDVFGNLTVIFISRKVDVNLSTKEGQLEGLKIYDQIVSELRAHVVALTLEVEKFADQWDNAYRRTWGKNESIPYADLPWAEKQQNTITEQKMQKLFPEGRLSDAMERLFEGASCIGTGYKYEEDYLKKEDEKEE